MSLKFPISLVGKRTSLIPPSGILSILYTSNGGVLAEIDGDIPDGYNNEEVLTSPARLSIGSSCGSIGSYAFGYNSNLTIIDTLDPPPSTLTNIGDYAFFDTPITGSVFLPSTLDLGIGVFYGTNITDVTIEMETLGNKADEYGMFENCGEIESVTLLDSCKNVDGPVFYDTRPDQSGGTAQFTLDLGSVVNISSIGSYYGPFEYSGAIGNLNLPNTVEIIGDYAFSSSNGLTGSLTIPDSVTTIGNSAFRSCTGLTGSLTIPDSVTSIRSQAFLGLIGLTGSLTIGNSVTSIEFAAFAGCDGLTGSLTIGNSVTTIGSSAFYNCSSITALYTNTPAASWGGYSALALTTALVNIYYGPDANGGTGYSATFQGGSGMTVSAWTNYPNIP